TEADGFTDGPEAIVTLAGIQRAVSSDGGWWRGDPSVMAVPARGLSSEGYARERLEAVRSLVQAPDTVLRGDPWSHEMDAPEATCTRDPYPSATRGSPDAASGEAIGEPSNTTSLDGTPDAPDAPDAPSYTSHLAVVDAEGNAVS